MNRRQGRLPSQSIWISPVAAADNAAALYATFWTRQLRRVQPQLFDDSQHDAVWKALAGSHQGNFCHAAFAPHPDTSVTEVFGSAAWHLVEMAASLEQPLPEC